jgi:hypothetical protein
MAAILTEGACLQQSQKEALNLKRSLVIIDNLKGISQMPLPINIQTLLQRNLRNAITWLIELEFIAYTHPNTIRNKIQQYMITPSGLKFLHGQPK